MIIQTRQIADLFAAVISRRNYKVPGKTAPWQSSWENSILGVPVTLYVSDIELSWQCTGPGWSLGFRFAPADAKMIQDYDSDAAGADVGYLFSRLGQFGDPWVDGDVEALTQMLVQITITGKSQFSQIESNPITFKRITP